MVEVIETKQIKQLTPLAEIPAGAELAMQGDEGPAGRFPVDPMLARGNHTGTQSIDTIVDFLQPGGNAVPRLPTEKLRDFLAFKDFGAIGDNVVNDRAALVGAVADADGRMIVVTPGTYKLATPYAAPDGTRIYMQAGASFATNKPTGASIQYERYNTAGIAGSKMKVDHCFEASSFPIENEAGIWSAGTYAYFGISKEMTIDTVDDQSSAEIGGGPLIGMFAFVNNNGATGDVVGFLSSVVARQNDGVAFGANFIARNDGGTTNTKLVGLEIDVEPAIGTTMANGSCGLVMNIFSLDGPAPIFQGGGVGGGSWQNGFITSAVRGAHYAVLAGDTETSVCFIDTTNGTFSSAAIKLGVNAAQAINFGGGSFGTSPYLYGATGGDLVVNQGASGFFVIKNPAGSNRFTFDQFGTINMPNNGKIQISGTQVVQQRDTGWSAMTGTSNKNTVYDTASVTLPQLAGRVMAMQAALTSHGLIGA